MRKLICMLLALTVVLCGCTQAEQPRETTASEGTEPVTVPFKEVDPPKATLPKGDRGEQETQLPKPMGGTGAQRIEYKQNVSSVRYITRVEDLPDYEALDGYRNAEYFEKKALLVVLDTVTSGSVKVSIGTVGAGTVTLGREMDGDVGTSDMAAWLLWAEVEQGLDYRWSVTNPGVRSNLSTY